MYALKSIGSGQAIQAPLNSSGYAILLLDVRDQLLHEGVAVWTVVGRVHGVGVVVVRGGVLNLDHEHSGEARAGPVLVELIGILLLDPVVALELEPSARVRHQVGIGRRFPPSADRLRKVPVRDHQGIAGVGVLVEALGQEHVRAKIDWAAPELGEKPALDPHVLDVLGLLGRRNRGDLLIQ